MILIIRKNVLIVLGVKPMILITMVLIVVGVRVMLQIIQEQRPVHYVVMFIPINRHIIRVQNLIIQAMNR